MPWTSVSIRALSGFGLFKSLMPRIVSYDIFIIPHMQD